MHEVLGVGAFPKGEGPAARRAPRLGLNFGEVPLEEGPYAFVKTKAI
jgi:hypothetical protein